MSNICTGANRGNWKCKRDAVPGLKTCKECLAAKRRYRVVNQEKIRISERESKHRIRMASLARLGNRCIQCGFRDWRALQIDHINGKGRKECRELGADGIQRKILSMKNPETEYQCLCANCNWIKRYENGEHK